MKEASSLPPERENDFSVALRKMYYISSNLVVEKIPA
jgi:hypothetical protein